MAAVFSFTRSEADILQELLRVFNSGRGSAREQWATQAEILVEPTGWDALWKLSKSFCKKFEVRYPCVAVVTATQVDFDNLSATVDVVKVQHEAVSLPEQVEDVPLVELWPTEKQQESTVNARATAELIDLLRFYFNHIWMPWDNQDDKILLPDTIEERFQLWSEVRSGTIPSFLARTITHIRNSAIETHEKLKELDLSLGETDDDDSLLPPAYLATCAELNAKLDGLQAQWTLYEDPRIREQYLLKMKEKWVKNKSRKNIVALWEGGSILEFDEICNYLRTRVSTNQTLLVLTSAQEALSLDPIEMIICNKEYDMPECNLANIALCSFNGAVLTTTDTRSCLILLSEATSVRDVTMQSTNVNMCVVVRGHPHSIDNCILKTKERQPDVLNLKLMTSRCYNVFWRILRVLQAYSASLLMTAFMAFLTKGIMTRQQRRVTIQVSEEDARDKQAKLTALVQKIMEKLAKDDFAQGLVAMPDSKVIIQNTTFDNFHTGIVVHKGAQVELRSCTIKNCGVGIQMYAGGRISLNNTTIQDCSEQSIRCEIDSNTKMTGDGSDAGEGMSSEAVLLEALPGGSTYAQRAASSLKSFLLSGVAAGVTVVPAQTQLDSFSVEGLNIGQNCMIGKGDLQKEIAIVKQDIEHSVI